MTTRRKNALSVKKALKQGEGSIHTWGWEKFKRLYPTIKCNSCCFSGYHLIIVCNEAYNSNCENTNADMKTKFYHVLSIQLVHCLFPRMEKLEKVEPYMCKNLYIFYGHDHSTVMESNLDSNIITIYDGINLARNNWFHHHITNVLKWTKLIGRNSLPTFHSNGKI